MTLGDWLIALSFELASEAAAQIAKTPKLVTLLARHMATTTAGEAMEFEFDRKNDWDTYLQIAADKTAPLLTAPLQGVAIMALDVRAEMVVASYFRYLGKAYQIANDILNFDGNDGAKSIGSDLARRAPNAVTLSFRNGLTPVNKLNLTCGTRLETIPRFWIGRRKSVIPMQWSVLAVVCCLF